MGNVLFLSNHDYRSPRRANIHFLAKEATKKFDRVSFFSIGYSKLSNPTKDVRIPLDAQANRWVEYDGVQCFLWKTAFHPGKGNGLLRSTLANILYGLYARYPSSELNTAIAQADTVVFESGLSPIFIRRVARAAPSKRLIYIASDRLSTIAVHPHVIRDFNRGINCFDFIRIPARDMAMDFTAAGERVHFIAHGIDKEIFKTPPPSPFTTPLNAVSVGSMLFDPQYFFLVAPHFPDVTFHVIGSKQKHDFPTNVVQYDEMPFLETTKYVMNATIGIAPYRAIEGGEYLADSSMKMRQFGYAGLPAVCSNFAAGDVPRRFGYDPLKPETMIAATAAALEAGKVKEPIDCLDWSQIAGLIFDVPQPD